MRNTLICTVGTSLFSNLSRLSKEEDNEIFINIKNHFDNSNWVELSKSLQELKPTERLCGAEINTIEEAKKKKWLQLENLILLVSETEAGKNTGYLLEKYFEGRNDLALEQVKRKVIIQLHGAVSKSFKIHVL
jgi:CRISPR/Cas system-associated protein Csm6